LQSSKPTNLRRIGLAALAVVALGAVTVVMLRPDSPTPSRTEAADASTETDHQSNNTRAIGVRERTTPATPPDAGNAGSIIAPLPEPARRGSSAMFVGVNRFTVDPGLRPLRFAVNDAVAQAHLFVLELQLIPPGNAYLAISGEPSNEPRQAELAALKEAGVQLVDAGRARLIKHLMTVAGIPRDPADLLIVSVASHGFERAGAPYAMPADGLRTRLADTALNLLEVERLLAKSKAGKRLLLLDVCREQASDDTRGLTPTMTDAFRRALAAARGQVVLASCDAGQVSYEDRAAEHGVFTRALLEGLAGRATPDVRGYITLGGVADYVHVAVRDWVVRHRAAEDEALMQSPWFKGPKTAEDIPLAQHIVEREKAMSFEKRRDAAVEKLKTKIELEGPLTPAVFERTAELVATTQANDAGRGLVETIESLHAGEVQVGVFVAYVEHRIRLREERTAEHEVEDDGPPPGAATTKESGTLPDPATLRAERIAALLDEARALVAKDTRTAGKTAITKLDELLELAPDHADALALREQAEALLGPKPGETIENSIGMKLAFIPSGRFVMGSPPDEPGREDDETQHPVVITQPFFMGTTEVTQAQWQQVMGRSRSQFEGDDRPVEWVSWDEAVEFCRRLSRLESTPDEPRRYRLPTEAQWEYAARAGTRSPFHFGFTITTDQANYSGRFVYPGGERGEDRRQTLPVASFKPNAWNLHDMHGNVWEWCADWYGDYPAGEVRDPAGPPTGERRVVRGGSFVFTPQVCRSANRDHESPNRRLNSLGFRVVLEVSD